MKDQVFDGATVEEAAAGAARALGIPAERLRYVVLDTGTVAARGLTARPARIAVLLGASPGPGTGRPAAPGPAGPVPAARPTVTPPAAQGVTEVSAAIRELIRELARAADTDLAGEVTATEEAVVVRLEGKGKDLLLEDEGDVLQALEYLLQLMYRRAIEPRRLVVDCEGYRSDRDRALHEEALALAAVVAVDGAPRQMRALNSYERRVVHAAQHRVRLLHHARQRLKHLLAGQAAAPGELGGPVAQDGRSAQTADDPLADISGEVEQEVGDAVAVFVGPEPDLLGGEQGAAAANLREMVGELVACAAAKDRGNVRRTAHAPILPHAGYHARS